MGALVIGDLEPLHGQGGAGRLAGAGVVLRPPGDAQRLQAPARRQCRDPP